MPDLDRLNDLVRELEATASGENALLLEHLESARFYLSGAMPAEYRLSLEMAEKQLASVADDGTRNRLREFIQSHLTVGNHAAS